MQIITCRHSLDENSYYELVPRLWEQPPLDDDLLDLPKCVNKYKSMHLCREEKSIS